MTAVTVPALAAQKFLRGMPDDHLALLAGAASLVTMPAGDRVFEAGGIAHSFWLIRSGQVVLDLQVPGRGRLVIDSLGRGELTGVSWFFPPYQWQSGALAVQPVEAFEFDAAMVRQLCDSDPGFGYELTRRLIVVVARRLQATRRRALEAGPAAGPAGT